MAAPVNANINVLVNTQQAMAQLRALQGQITTLNGSLSATSGAAAAQQAALAKGLKDSANASRMWQARIVPMNTSVQQFSNALDKGKMSLGQYTRYATSQLPGMSKVFKREFEMMNRVATQNVKQMQTQYVALGQSATGAAQAMALTPTALNKQAAATAIAAQRQMMMNRMIDLGTTKLLNWGKNTQWAGRQLMVGFSIPLAMVGAVAAKTFKEIDKGSIAFKRVYGDLSTTTAEMERNLDAVKALGQEYTKYGLGLADIIELSADVAATGAKNESLMAATEQTLRLSTLGLMEYGEALDATISLQTAFQVSNEDLAGTIDFLNVVENETILTMQDMAAAIPRVAPVVRGLGGDVKDLAVFMTAMREGGVTAEQGANALKSGLGRLINPTKAAREVMDGFGLSIDAIIQSNRGDLMGMVQSFGDALSTLGDFEQQQVLEKVFGKYQYARLGALFKNLSNDASQAQRTIELTNMSIEDLASISERELGKIEEATSTKFQAAIERLKVSIAPVGEQFMKALMPVIDFVTKIANSFNDLPDSIKNAIAIGVAAIAGIGPVVLMTVGLIANGIANIGKLVQAMRKFFAKLRGDASLFDYLTQEEREAATAANALSGATDNLTGKFLGQRRALESLITMVGRYASAMSSAAAAAPIGFGMGAGAAARGATARGTVVTGLGGLRMAKGGVVPGVGNKDTVPAMLTPGESVVTKEATQKYGPMIKAMNAGTIPGFSDGVVAAGTRTAQSGGRTQFQSQSALVSGHMGGAMMLPVKQELARVESNIAAYSRSYVAYLRQLDASGQKFVRTYSNLVVLMSQELNEDIKNGQANIARVKTEIGNPAAQVELKRQLKLLGMQDDEIAQVLNKYVKNLNAQLDAAQARLGTGNLSAAQMDRVMNRAAVGAAGRTFTDPAQRAMFARLATTPTTYLPGEGKGRRTMQSGAASRANPEMRSYTSLRGSYGISAATKFSNAGIAAAGFTPQAMQAIFAGMPAAAQQAIIATKGNLEKAIPIFKEYGLKAGVVYNEGLVSAVAGGKPNVSQAVSKNRQAASPAPWAAPMGMQDGGAYGKGFTTSAAKEAAKIKQSIMGMSGGKPGGLPPAQQALAQGTRVRPQGFPASVYNPSNNPAGLGLTGEAKAMRGLAGAIESRTAVHRRAQAQEEAMLAEQNKFKVTDRRLSGVKQQTAVVLGEELTWLEKQSLATQKLAQQRAVNEAALKAEQEAQARLNGAKQRAAVLQETINQRPARGGMLDRPLGAIRRFAFPGGQDAALKNLGFNQFTGQVKTAGQLIVESAQNIKTRVAGSLRTLPGDLKIATQQLLNETKLAGAQLAKDFKGLGTTIKTNMQVDLDNVRRAASRAAGAVGKLATSAGAAAQRMAAATTGFLAGGVDSEGRTRGQRMAGMGNMAMMGLMGLSMAASMASGEIGEMAQKIMPVAMGLMGLQMILPLLSNPVTAAAVAVGALAGVAMYGQSKIRSLANEAAQAGESLGQVSNVAKVLEEALGIKLNERQNRLFRFTEEDRKAMEQFTGFFEGESGQNLVEELRGLTSEERYQKVANLMSRAIAAGADEEQAKAFGQSIAQELEDSLLNSTIARDFARGVFAEGSQALLDLEKRRISENRPALGNLSDIRTGSIGLTAALAGDTAQSGGYFGDLLDNIAAPFIETVNEVAAERGGKSLGFAISSLTNLRDAEDLLTTERRNGTISAEEYGKRLDEINRLQKTNIDEIKKAIDFVGPDAPDIRPVFEERLKAAGFDEGKIAEIFDRISPEDLADRFFEDKGGWDKLDWAERQFVAEVFAGTIDNLNPSNWGNKLADIEDTWSIVADDAVEAIRGGIDSVSGVNIQDMFNKQELSDWLKYNFGDSLESANIAPEFAAQNILDAGQSLTGLGTDMFEVQSLLQSFTDPDIVASIVSTKDGIVELGEAMVALKDYKNISIEFVMDKDIDIDELVSQLNQIKDIKFDKKKFGKDFDDFRSIILNALPSADEWAQTALELGVPVEQLFSRYKDGAEEVGKAIIDIPGKTKEAFTKAGKIKPKLTVSLITTLLGGIVDNPGAAAARIANAVDAPLTPLQLMIMVSLGGEGAGLLQDPDFLKAAALGENITTTTGYAYGAPTIAKTQYTKEQLAFGKTFLDAGKKPGPAGEKPPAGEDTSGGGSETKSWLEGLAEEISSNLQLFVGNVSKSISPLMGQIRSKFKGMEIPTRILEMIGAGPEGVARAKELLGLSKGQMKKLIKDFIRSTGAEAVQGLKVEIGQTVRKTQAANKLSGENEETRDIILEDQALVDVIATYKKSSPEYTKAIEKARRLAKARKALTEATKEEETAEEKLTRELGLQQDAFDRFQTAMEQGFDAAEIEAADKVAGKFFNDNTALAEKLAESTGHTVENGYQLADALDRQIQKNQRLIDIEQDKIDKRQEEIRDYERTNSLIQQGIDDLKRNDEIRNRRSEGLSRDLEQIAKAEEDIRKSYQDRIDALDKIASANQYLIDQQKKQLDLSRAISEGDIYAATQAAQEMRAASAQQAVDQRRAALESGMELSIEGLTNDEGMTRAQIEEEINNIKEQNYQNSLKIRIEEDKAYKNSLEIRRLTNEIYDINEDIIEPLQNQNNEYQRMLEYYEEDEEYAIKRVTLAGLTREEFEKQADALELAITNAEKLDPYLEKLAGRYNKIWTAAKGAADEAARLARLQGAATKKKEDDENKFAGGMIKKYAVGGMINTRRYTSNEPPPAQMSIGGSVFGSGARDSVAAMLTPGEFVIRKAMVDKYGMPMFNKINQGSFAMPRYNADTSSAGNVKVNNQNTSNVVAPMYNNYSVNVSVSNTNASADEIATKAIMKIRQMNDMQIRGGRGY